VDAISVTAKIGAFGKCSSDLIGDNGSTLSIAYSDDPFAIRFGNTSARVGINCDASSDFALDCAGGARFSGVVIAGSPVVINSGDDEVPFICGNNDSYLRIKNGRHLDSYSRADGSGRDLNLCMHTGMAVRCSSKLAVGMTPNAYQLAVQGAANVSDFIMCPAYRIGSDQRLKEDVEDASWDECTRLLLAIRPKTYVLKSSGRVECGYIAQDFQREAKDAYRNSVLGESLGDEKMLALDYSRVIPILHAALLSALARIEALESRLT
jgi:hypothetical protein